MSLRAGKGIPGPAFDLVEFQARARAGDFHVYKTRAANIIGALLSYSRSRAVEYAKQVVLSLTPGDYAHTLEMPNGQLHDVYGKLIEAEGWYVKIEIHIRDGQPGIVSCHPAEHDLATKNGVVPRSRRRFP
ncbi:MAG TPA: hypothetical protein VF006_02390 [Longimicrobium sp.]